MRTKADSLLRPAEELNGVREGRQVRSPSTDIAVSVGGVRRLSKSLEEGSHAACFELHPYQSTEIEF